MGCGLKPTNLLENKWVLPIPTNLSSLELCLHKFLKWHKRMGCAGLFSCRHSMMGWRQRWVCFLYTANALLSNPFATLWKPAHKGSSSLRLWMPLHAISFLQLLDRFHKAAAKQNWCSVVSCVCSWRRFLLQHLAQIKHILPEAVKLEYIKCWDSDLQRNKWDLCISLLPMPAAGAAAVDDDESELLEGDLLESSKLIYSKQGNSHIETVRRRRAFHTRLLEFASTHLEVQGRTSTLITTSWCFWCSVNFLLVDGICSK